MAVAQALLDLLDIFVIVVTGYVKAFVLLLLPSKPKSIGGQVALVTGSGHGIGREIALALSKAGAVVVLWDINTKGNEETAKIICDSGGSAHADTVDVTNTARVKEAADKIRRDLGEVNILVNNAGYLNCARLLDLPQSAIRRTFEVNILGQFWLVQEFLPSMQAKNFGHIVNVASMAGYYGMELMTDYSSTKFASRGFSDALRRELGLDPNNKVKITCVCPMYVETGFLRTATVKPEDILSPEQVASATVEGILKDKELVTVPGSVEYVFRAGGLLPLATFNKVAKKLVFTVKAQYNKDA